jgi:hypothetical protein
MTNTDDNEEAYLEMPPESLKNFAPPETIWAKISDDGKLEILRWDIVEMYALEFDTYKRNNQEPRQTHVISKLLVLVRDQTRKECEAQHGTRQEERR